MWAAAMFPWEFNVGTVQRPFTDGAAAAGPAS
jgi:hypothetical protein